MSQTSIIAGSLVIAFLVFVTVRGQLPCYLEIIGLSTSGQCKSIAGISGTINLTSSGPQVTVKPPSVGVGPVTVQAPSIRI